MTTPLTPPAQLPPQNTPVAGQPEEIDPSTLAGYSAAPAATEVPAGAEEISPDSLKHYASAPEGDLVPEEIDPASLSEYKSADQLDHEAKLKAVESINSTSELARLADEDRAKGDNGMLSVYRDRYAVLKAIDMAKSLDQKVAEAGLEFLKGLKDAPKAIGESVGTAAGLVADAINPPGSEYQFRRVLGVPIPILDRVPGTGDPKVAQDAAKTVDAAIQTGLTQSSVAGQKTVRGAYELLGGEINIAKRFEDDIAQAARERAASRGEALPEAAKALPGEVNPEQAQAASMVFDPTNLAFGISGLATGLRRSLVGDGIRSAALTLETAGEAQAKAAAERTVVGDLAGGAVKGAGEAINAVGEAITDKPVVAAALGGTAALLTGGDPVRGAFYGSASAIAARRAAKFVGSSMVTLGDRMANQAPFGGKVAQTLEDMLVAGGHGAAGMSPFILGADTSEERGKTLATGAAFGAAGALAAKPVKFWSDLSIRDIFKDKDTTPDADIKRPAAPKYGLELDEQHAEALQNLSNRGAATFDGLRQLLNKISDTPVELWYLDQSGINKLAEHYGVSRADGKAGFNYDVTDTDGKVVKTVQAINANQRGVAAGHEPGHVIWRLLSRDQQNRFFNTAYDLYGQDNLLAFGDHYNELANRDAVKRGEGAVDYLKATDQKSKLDHIVEEMFAEQTSAYLNGIPFDRFGQSSVFGDQVRNVLGTLAERTGLIDPANGRLKTGLGVSPSYTLRGMIENYTTALANEGRGDARVAAAPSDTPVFGTPEHPARSTPSAPPEPTGKPVAPDADAPANSRPSPRPTDVKGFKRGDPIGEVRNAKGQLVAEAAKITKVLDVRDGVQHYEIEYVHPDTGEVKLGEVPETWLQSPRGTIKVDPNAEVFYRGPVSTETPAGSAQTLKDIPAGEAKHYVDGKGNPVTEAQVAEARGEPVPPTPEAVVAPRHEEGTHKLPENARGVTPAEREVLAKKASPEVQKDNVKIIQDEVAKPASEQRLLKTNYYSAGGADASDTGPVREERRNLVAAAESHGAQGLSRLYEKLIHVFQYEPNPKNGRPWVTAFSFDNFIANMKLLDGWIKDNTRFYGIKERMDSPGFTQAVQDYWKNQANGYRGDGGRLVRPKDLLPGTVPDEVPGYKPVQIAPKDMQIINLLMGIERPQKSTVATQFAGKMARENGLTPTLDKNGAEVTNPLTAALNAEGFDQNLLHSTIQRLSLDKLTDVLTPSQYKGTSTPVTATIRAGFMPAAPRGTEVMSGAKGEPEQGLLERRSVRAAEDAFSRHSSYVATDRGVILHSAKLRSTAFLSPENAEAFLKKVEAAKSPAAKDRIIEANFMPAVRDFFGGPEQLDTALREHGWAILTGTQEQYGDHTSRVNVNANDALSQRLEREGSPFVELEGKYKGTDQGPSVLVLTDSANALKLARQFGQESILTSDGLVYTDGRPNTPTTGYVIGPEALKSDFYSVLPNGTPFSAHLDFTGTGRTTSHRIGDTVTVTNPARSDRNTTGQIVSAVHDPIDTKRRTGAVGTNTRYEVKFPDGHTQELYDWELKKPKLEPSYMPLAAVQHTAAKPLEHSLGDKVFNLIHFSTAAVKGLLDPKKMGSGHANQMDMAGLPKSFFFEQGSRYGADRTLVTQDGKAPVFGAKVSGAKIYDYARDPLEVSDIINREKRDQTLVDAGYVGYRAETQDGRKVFAIFEPTKVQRIDKPTSKFMPAAPRPDAKEWIGPAAIRLENGKIFSGAAHWQAFAKALVKFPAGSPETSSGVQDGWLTNKGRFLNREDAMSLAKEAGQLDVRAYERSNRAYEREEGSRIRLDDGELESYAFDASRRFMPAAPAEGAKDWVDSAAIRVGGKVFTGHNHYDAYQKAEAAVSRGELPAGALAGITPSESDGYVSHLGNFLSRADSYKLAADAGQIDPKEYLDYQKSIGAYHDWKDAAGNRKLESTAFHETAKFMPAAEGANGGFYSTLEDTLSKIPAHATLSQLEAALRDGVKEKGNLIGRPVKAEEMRDVKDQTGRTFEEYLKENPNATRDELLSFAQENRVQVSEKTLGSDAADVEAWWNDEGGANESVPFSDLTSRERSAAINRYNEEVAQHQESDPVKYSGYTLPGGENYREHIFTLPEKTAPEAKWNVQEEKLNLPNREGHASPVDTKTWEANIGGADYRITWNPHTGKYRLDGEKGGIQNAQFGTLEEAMRRAEVGTDYKYSGRGGFRSSHFGDVPNYLAHARTNERTLPDGKSALFAEELQSDLHQQGRREGYAERVSPEEEAAVKKQLYETAENVSSLERAVLTGESQGLTNTPLHARFVENLAKAREQNAAASEKLRQIQDKKSGVADAPFKKSWHELVFKNLLRKAAESGKDFLAWTTGEQQAERYDLSKSVSAVSYRPRKNGKYDVLVRDNNGRTVVEATMLPEEISSVLGKEITEKIAAGGGKLAKNELDNGDVAEMTTLSGLDLKIGGGGMKGFYDEILPRFADKYLKKYGIKTEDLNLGGSKAFKVLDGNDNLLGSFNTKAEAVTFLRANKEAATIQSPTGKAADETPQVVHSVRITPELRKDVLEKGQPLYMPKASPAQERVLKDSKVRGPLGDLLPVVHATYSDFKKLGDKPGQRDLGWHFGTAEAANARVGKALADVSGPEVSAENAFDAFPEVRGNMPPGARGALEGIAEGVRSIPAFLDIKNPLRMEDVGPWNDPDEVFAALPDKVQDALPQSVRDAVFKYNNWVDNFNGNPKTYDDVREKQATPVLKEIREGLKKIGYDGVVYQNQFEGKDAPTDSYIAFDHKQVVPAFDAGAKTRWMPAEEKTVTPEAPEKIDPRKTRAWKALAQNLTPDEAKRRSDTAQQMLELYKELPHDSDFETAVTAGLIKRGWYDRAGQTIRQIFGADTEKFVGLLASLSPRQSVAENMHMALKIWADWKDAGSPTDKATLQDIIENHAELHARVPNSIRALQGDELADPPLPADAIDSKAKKSGFKVESFRRNLLGDLNASTNDTWMARFANIDQSVFGSKAGYLAFNAKVRKVAAKFDMQPAEVQETIWSFMKTLDEATTVAKSAQENLRSLSDSDILKTPEFHDVIHNEVLTNPRVRAQLERLGYAGLDTLTRAQNPQPRPGTIAEIVAREGGPRGSRALERIANRVQELKDAELAATRKLIGEEKPAPVPQPEFPKRRKPIAPEITDDNVPFMPKASLPAAIQEKLALPDAPKKWRFTVKRDEEGKMEEIVAEAQ